MVADFQLVFSLRALCVSLPVLIYKIPDGHVSFLQAVSWSVGPFQFGWYLARPFHRNFPVRTPVGTLCSLPRWLLAVWVAWLLSPRLAVLVCTPSLRPVTTNR